MFKLGRSKWINFIVGLTLFGLATAGLLYYLSIEKGPIYEYNAKRDKKPLLDLFYKDWYWFINVPKGQYSPEFTFQYKTPKRDPRYYGKLIVKVLRENDIFMGFTAYYKINFYKGRLLFLAIDEKFRRRGFGEMLSRYALEDLFKRGCSIILVLTRTENKARLLYKKLGFKETKLEDGFVHYAITKDEYNKHKK